MYDKKINEFPTLEQLQDDDLLLVASGDNTFNVRYATLNEEAKNDLENKLDKFQGLENADKQLTVDSKGYINLDNVPRLNGITLKGDISLADIKAQPALNKGILKDIIVIKSYAEYEEVFGNDEKMAELTESLQEGEYILLVLIETDLGDGEPVTIITTMSADNGELVFNDGFSTGILKEYIEKQIRDSINPLEEELDAITTIVEEKSDLTFELKHNCEQRSLNPFHDSLWLQWSLPTEIPENYISGFVFVCKSEPRTLSYPDSIIFTGDDVIDDVLVPMANKVYNVIFWYDGINVNAVSRGVPYAQE